MSRTNYGNGYKFQAVMKSRATKNTVTVQWMRKDGTWGKPQETPRFGTETDEEVIERLIKLNDREVRLAE